MNATKFAHNLIFISTNESIYTLFPINELTITSFSKFEPTPSAFIKNEPIFPQGGGWILGGQTPTVPNS